MQSFRFRHYMITQTHLRAHWPWRPLVSLHPWESHVALESWESTLPLRDTHQQEDEAAQI